MQDCGASLTVDGLSLFFTSRRSGGLEGYDIWVATRETVNDDWSESAKLGPAVNMTDQSEWDPSISSDGLELYFSRGPGHTNHDLYVTTRETTNDEWSTAVSLGETINSPAEDGDPCVSADGLSLYLSSSRTGGEGERDLYVTTRLTKNDTWSAPVNLGPTVNSSRADFAPSITSDGLTLIFSSQRYPRYSNYYDLLMTKRRTTSDPWGEPINLGPIINTDDLDYADISPDGQTLYIYCWNWPGGYGLYDIYEAPIIPIVDLNSDGIVDAADMCVLIDHWGENYPLCDIGPMPLGDGIVDIEDMKVLAENLFGLIGYWMLDETEGNIAHNSAGGSDGFINGEPAWQPDGGVVTGALQLDGIDDYVSTNPVLNPAEGPFSIFAWVNGGAPGQVVISQEGGADWLMTDAEGNLMTKLTSPGRSGGPLFSQTNITDGNWHRISLVWDGSNRTLYVDGISVAEDTQDGLGGSVSSLYIGCGKAMEAGTYWSGLIDDVRIYNRAVTP